MFLIIKTPKHELKAKCEYGFIKCSEVKVNKVLFDKMCKEGCRNYGKKYCCPPIAPSFKRLAKGYDAMLVVHMYANLDQLEGYGYKDYLKVMLANSCLKSRCEKVMRMLKDKAGGILLGSGACKKCRPCNLTKGLPCKHPDLKRYSLEATGVDCNYLTKKMFNKELLWYKNGKAPGRTAVVYGLLINDKEMKSLKKEIKLIFNKWARSSAW